MSNSTVVMYSSTLMISNLTKGVKTWVDCHKLFVLRTRHYLSNLINRSIHNSSHSEGMPVISAVTIAKRRRNQALGICVTLRSTIRCTVLHQMSLETTMVIPWVQLSKPWSSTLRRLPRYRDSTNLRRSRHESAATIRSISRNSWSKIKPPHLPHQLVIKSLSGKT